MKAVLVEKPHVVTVVDLPEPTPGPDDVVVKVAACGICGTDLHIIDGEFPPTVYPIVIGHEFGGEVVALGSAVSGFAIGDRVGVDPTLNCGACYFCQRGMGNLCERWNAIGVGTHQGGFAKYVSVPARDVYPIPDDMTMQAAALIEPVSCVVRGFHRLQPQLGKSYLIYGAGPMGLFNAQVAHYSGASLVAMIDINQSRLDRARGQFGIEHVAHGLDDLPMWRPAGSTTSSRPPE